jgi:2-C-methyl-D-erythritol 2,4-cyclodiphosphate synthase
VAERVEEITPRPQNHPHPDALPVQAEAALHAINKPVYEGAYMFRVGFGYDAHRLVEGRRLILGGIDIPWKLGLLGHSDADVLVHAIMDGILGALGKGDIGRHFPDTDPAYKDIDSLLMLKKVMSMAAEDGYLINNVDCTIVAQQPKLSPHIEAMREKLAPVLEVEKASVNIKATTTEGMGFAGKGEGMGAYAVVSLIKKV